MIADQDMIQCSSLCAYKKNSIIYCCEVIYRTKTHCVMG